MYFCKIYKVKELKTCTNSGITKIASIYFFNVHNANYLYIFLDTFYTYVEMFTNVYFLFNT